MLIPKRKRQNTIGVKYVKGVIKDEHYVKVIETILGLRDEDILKIEEFSTTKFLFQLDKENYENVCRNHICKFITLDEDSIIMVEDISSYNTEIYVTNIQFDITEEEVLQILKSYGKIKNHYYRGKQNIKYFQGRGTGRMTAIMELHSPIPSALYIKDIASNLLISYAGQPITCHRCGDLTHKIKFCNKQIGTGINAIDHDPETIDETETKSETDGEPSDDVKETDEQKTNEELDEPPVNPLASPLPGASHSLIDPSPAQESPDEKPMQVSNSHLNGPICVSTPTQGEPKEHIQTHTDEKPKCRLDESLKDKTDKNEIHTGEKSLDHTEEKLCNKCNMIFTTDDELSEHVQAHLGFALFKCSECGYQTKKIEDLTNHMTEKLHMLDHVKGMEGISTRWTFAQKVKNNPLGRPK